MTTLVLPHVTRRPHRPRGVTAVDWAMATGIVFFGALVVLAIYGPLVAPHDVYYTRSLLDGAAPPFPPSPTYPLGSDSIGRDRFSLLLISARGSVVLAIGAATLRLGVGASLGIIAAFKAGPLGSMLRRVALGLSSVPATIAALLAVIALGMRPEQFVLALGLIGWAEPFHQARRYARSESARPYMESARSLGLSDGRLLLRHLLPNLAPQLLTTAAFQVSAVLLLMAELALLNIFVGGAVLVDYDMRGNPITVARIPNWASMLAATRPIVSLYGDLASVLLPGAALLGAVVATNLFGDALAGRAQQLDVYRLFSRRQIFALAVCAAVIGVSVRAWPSRLHPELEYAQGVDERVAMALTQELVALGPRSTGSSEAERAAGLLAERMDGTVSRTTDVTARVRASSVQVTGRPLREDAVTVLSIDPADAQGPLVFVDAQAIFSARGVPDVRDAVVLVAQVSPGVLATLEQRLAAGHAAGLVLIDDNALNFRREPALYPLATIRTTRRAVTEALQRELPDLRTIPSRYAVLADRARIHVETERVTTPVADVFARVLSRPDAPLIVLTASYDAAPGNPAVWQTASGPAVLDAVVQYLRAHPLDLDVIAVSTSADYQNYAGVRWGLAALDADERHRLQAVVVIGPVQSDAIGLLTQLEQGVASGTGRLAARLADAMSLRASSAPPGDLLRAIRASDVAAGVLVLDAPGADVPVSPTALKRAAETILAALAYVPRHQDELR